MGKALIEEWKVLKDAEVDIQKTLNQWSHTYKIKIQGISCSSTTGELIVLLTREKY
jgi:dihydrodipicolinate synthase/N-acetylneuraminate lyase